MFLWNRRWVIERREFAREFKLEAVKLVKERSIAYAQASRDLDVHQTVLRNWVKAFADDPAQAFPGHGQQKPEQAEITRLKREVTKLKAERDIQKKQRPNSRRRAREVLLHREAPWDLTGGMDARGARCLARWPLWLATTWSMTYHPRLSAGHQLGAADALSSTISLVISSCRA